MYNSTYIYYLFELMHSKKSLIQNSLVVKKCATPKNFVVKKGMKFKVVPRSSYDGRLKAKINNDSSGECVLHSPCFTMIRHQIHLNCRY